MNLKELYEKETGKKVYDVLGEWTSVNNYIQWLENRSTNIKTDATIEQLSEFLSKNIREDYYIGSFDRCRDFEQVSEENLIKNIIEYIIEFTKIHPVKNEK